MARCQPMLWCRNVEFLQVSVVLLSCTLPFIIKCAGEVEVLRFSPVI